MYVLMYGSLDCFISSRVSLCLCAQMCTKPLYVHVVQPSLHLSCIRSSSRPSLKWLLNDTASSCDEGLVQQLLNTVATMEEVVKRYQPEEICLAFNGGKDCTVLLDLFCATWTRYKTWVEID